VLPEAARFCPACAAPVEAAKATDERKLVTMLFADLVGSTAFASDEDPERVRALLDSFYQAMAAEAEAAGGTVEKFAGDAVLAAFGARASQEDHAERALHAALAMRRRFDELFGDRLSLRIGVNTGEVAVGPARVGGAFISGDAVNVAARLEQAAPSGEILAAERTVAAVGGAFEFADPQVIAAKGKEGGIACRGLVRALLLQRPRGISGLHAAFVGRDTELELLRATFRHAVSQGETHLVTIVGEPGVGKTRLVRELWELLVEEEPAPLRRTGRCLPYGDGITYWPLGEVLKEHFAILESDPPEEVTRRLAGREILGLALGLDVARDLHPLEARERLHEAAVAFVEELAAERPAVKLVEDIHWAEDDLLDLLERIVRDVRAPLVLLATARPELLDRRPTWGGGRRNVTTIWLEPLQPAETSRLVDELLAVELPATLRDLLVERAEGNPFFVEELLGALLDAGVLERRNGGLRIGEIPDAFSVPDSVQAVLAARIDRLPSMEKAALQAASVVGRIFWRGPVVHLLDGGEPDLALLEERDFIRRRAGSSIAGEREYAIKHALTREVAYASIPKARRGHLHAAFADWLERSDPARDDHASLLAYHFAEAVRPEDSDLAWAGQPEEAARLRGRAVVWLRRAAELARGRYEIDEAIQLLTGATELVDDPMERSELWREIGLCNALKFDGEAFWTAMQRSLEVCPDRATCADTYGLLAFHTASRSGMWRVRPDREVIGEWVERALELSEPGTAARARGLIARAYGDPSVSLNAAVEAGAIADRLGDPELRSYAWHARAKAAFDAQRYDEAVACVERRFELVDEITDPDHLSDLYGESIPYCAAVGRFREAWRIAERADEISSRLTPHHRVHGVSFLLELEELLGGWERIAELRERTERCVDANLNTPCIRNMRSLLVCAAATVELGREREGDLIEARAEEFGMAGHDYVLSAPRTRLALARGDGERLREIVALPFAPAGAWHGVAQLSTRLDGLVATRDKRVEEEALRFLRPGSYVEPFALRALGIVREDEELIARAQDRFRALGLDWHAAQTERLLAGL